MDMCAPNLGPARLKRLRLRVPFERLTGHLRIRTYGSWFIVQGSELMVRRDRLVIGN